MLDAAAFAFLYLPLIKDKAHARTARAERAVCKLGDPWQDFPVRLLLGMAFTLTVPGMVMFSCALARAVRHQRLSHPKDQPAAVEDESFVQSPFGGCREFSSMESI